MSTPPAPPAVHPSVRTGLSIASIFVSGLAVNWLSGLYEPAAAVISGIVLLSLLLLLMDARASSAHSVASVSGIRQETVDLITFGLASFLLGGIVGGLSVVPLGRTKSYELSIGAYVHNYELAAFGILVVMGALAALRHASLTQLIAFITATCSGATIAIVTLKPGENEFVSTFVGWWTIAVVASLVVSLAPDIVQQFRSFFRV